ncbi:hypothetical protein NDU88_009922 [Pleurodeles waltl]|uniref:Uncharacterized protein n=1 Tax=Pleurodeles waltl TaxID=8319 RepID=A0AAV7PWD2_PLEWA|nr:hypothetical protein NDU88_009922 [Pleurodeles waltl]
MAKLAPPCSLTLGPQLRALTAIWLFPGPAPLHSTCPGPSQADPLRADCSADQGPRAYVPHGAPLPKGPGADRLHLTAAPASHQGTSTGSRHQNGCPSCWRPKLTGHVPGRGLQAQISSVCHRRRQPLNRHLHGPHRAS